MDRVKNILRNHYVGITKEGRSVYIHPSHPEKRMYATGESLKDGTEWYHKDNHTEMHDAHAANPRDKVTKPVYMGHTQNGHPVYSNGEHMRKFIGKNYYRFNPETDGLILHNSPSHRQSGSRHSPTSLPMSLPMSLPTSLSMSHHSFLTGHHGLPMNTMGLSPLKQSHFREGDTIVGKKKDGGLVKIVCRAVYKNGKRVGDDEHIETPHGYDGPPIDIEHPEMLKGLTQEHLRKLDRVIGYSRTGEEVHEVCRLFDTNGVPLRSSEGLI